MGWLNSEKPPKKYDPSYIKMLVERIRTAYNFLNETNFPNKIFGGNIIQEKSLSVKALYGVEWQLAIVALGDPISITDTTLKNVGGFVHWSSAWGEDVKLYFEVTGGSMNSAAEAIFELHGADGKLAEVKTNQPLRWLRSEAFDPPKQSQTMHVKVRTTNSAHAAGLLSARLVIVPK